MTMQTIVTAVQNAVEFRDLGSATGATTFFRQMGGTIGAAVFGAILSNRLAFHLGDTRRRRWPGTRPINTNNLQAIQSLPEPIKIRADGVHQRAAMSSWSASRSSRSRWWSPSF